MLAILRHPSFFAFSFVLGAIFLATSSVGNAQPGNKLSARDAVLEQLWRLAPAERMELINKVVKKGDFGPAERGAVNNAVLERASLDVAKMTEIICKVKRSPNGDFAIITWLVDDGQAVKKGDKLIEFDSKPFEKEFERQKKTVAAVNADLQKAETELRRVQEDNAIEVKLAEIEVELADLAYQQYKGNDAQQKKALALQVDRARLLHQRAKLQAKVKDEHAEAVRDSKKTIRDRELAAQMEIKAVIEQCVVFAQQDGMIVYFVPEQAGRGPGNQAIVAQGEPVREGQKLLRICDLKQMIAVTKVPEAFISKVRVGQKTTIHVDAFPQRSYSGKVTRVATVPEQAAFFTRDVKVYRVEITIDANDDRLRPGMSADTSIATAERPNCLRLPVSTILTRDKDRYCYVQIDKELQMRKLTVGITDGSFVEVVDGLKEGDVVLRYPPAIVDRLVTVNKQK